MTTDGSTRSLGGSAGKNTEKELRKAKSPVSASQTFDECVSSSTQGAQKVSLVPDHREHSFGNVFSQECLEDQVFDRQVRSLEGMLRVRARVEAAEATLAETDLQGTEVKSASCDSGLGAGVRPAFDGHAGLVSRAACVSSGGSARGVTPADLNSGSLHRPLRDVVLEVALLVTVVLDLLFARSAVRVMVFTAELLAFPVVVNLALLIAPSAAMLNSGIQIGHSHYSRIQESQSSSLACARAIDMLHGFLLGGGGVLGSLGLLHGFLLGCLLHV